MIGVQTEITLIQLKIHFGCLNRLKSLIWKRIWLNSKTKDKVSIIKLPCSWHVQWFHPIRQIHVHVYAPVCVLNAIVVIPKGLSIGTKYLGTERFTSIEMYLVYADARTAMLSNRNLIKFPFKRNGLPYCEARLWENRRNRKSSIWIFWYLRYLFVLYSNILYIDGDVTTLLSTLY